MVNMVHIIHCRGNYTFLVIYLFICVCMKGGWGLAEEETFGIGGNVHFTYPGFPKKIKP